jgi:hypothetical protein
VKPTGYAEMVGFALLHPPYIIRHFIFDWTLGALGKNKKYPIDKNNSILKSYTL